MMSEEAIFKFSSGNGVIPYADEDGPSVMVNAPPRLGRSRIFAKEELMYATEYPGPSPKAPGTRIATPKSCGQERHDYSQRRCNAIDSRKISNKDADAEITNPLQRYENALLRYRKPNPRVLRKDRREPQNFRTNGYSSSDSECAISRCNKSKSTSSIDTQSVNNILDEYEDLDYGRSSDLSDSGSVSVTNFEAVMDQRKRQQQQQHCQLERSSQTVAEEQSAKAHEEQPQQPDQMNQIPEERPEPSLKVNQQTQVRRKSRDRRITSRDGPGKLNSDSEDALRSKQDPTLAVNTENSAENDIRSKPGLEILLRKGEVQKRVDEWLNQTQGQHFPAPSSKRESGRTVALVRSSSSADPKNLRRSRNDSRSRSTDENSGDRLNSTASYDDINRTELTRNDRKIDRTKNVGLNANKGTYEDYLAARNRSRLGADYGASKIPQRGHVGANFNMRRREIADSNAGACVQTTGTATTFVKPERHLSHSARTNVAGSRIAGISVKTKPDVTSNIGATSGTTSTSLLADVRATSFKRVRSNARNTSIVSGRVGGSLMVTEDQQSGGCGNARSRSEQPKQQSVPKGQIVAEVRQPLHQEPSVGTPPNKVGESRRLLVDGRESRTRNDPTKPASALSDASTKQYQHSSTTETARDNVGHHKSDAKSTKLSLDSSTESGEGDKDKMIKDQDGQVDNSGTASEQVSMCSPDRPKLLISRLVRENSNVTEPRRPPPPPRRVHSKRDKIEISSRVEQSMGQACSSFRPPKRTYPVFRGSNDKNSGLETSGEPVGPFSELSITKSHYASPKQVEKIYERTLEPEVIHADDFESILKPVARSFAYGEAAERESMRTVKNPSPVMNKNVADHSGFNVSRDGIANENNERSESPRSARYQQIDLDQSFPLSRIQPSSMIASNEVPVEKRDLPTKCWNRDEKIDNEPVKTFGTFQNVNSNRCHVVVNERKEPMNPCKIREDNDETVVVDVSEETTHQEPDLVPKTKLSIDNSYEAQSTLRICRNLTGDNSGDSNDRKSTKPSSCQTIAPKNCQISPAKSDRIAITSSSSMNCSEKTADVKFTDADDNKHRAVVNEVLVRNLHFKQDLSKQESPLRIVGPVVCAKPFNFNSVLSDDYDKIQAGDCTAERGDDCKIYVTKEEMDRQIMMDKLRRGDYEAVKLVRSCV